MEHDLIAGALTRARAHARQGDAQQALQALDQAEARVASATPLALRAEVLQARADAQLRLQGQFLAARDTARRAAQVYQQLGDLAGETQALGVQAIASARLGHYETGVDCALLAVRLSGSRDADPADRLDQVEAQRALGVAMFVGRCFTDALEAWAQALSMAQALVPRADTFALQADMASAEAMLAFSTRNLGQPPRPLDGLAAAVQAAEALLQDPTPCVELGLASRHNAFFTHALNATLLATWQGDLSEARRQQRRLTEALERSPRAWLQALTFWADAEMAVAQCDLLLARRHTDQMVAVARQHAHSIILHQGLSLTSYLALRSGKPDQALQALLEQQQHEQSARAASLRGRVSEVEVQLEVRRRRRELETLEASQAHFRQLAMQDELTGLPNRRQFEAELQALLTDLSSRPRAACLVMIDVDHFKAINDHHSHAVGDHVLQHLASLMRDSLAPGQLAARLAGDEFVLLLPDQDTTAARTLCDVLTTKVATHAWAELSPGLQVTVSLGVSDIRADDTRRSVLSRSDERMYAHKRSRR